MPKNYTKEQILIALTKGNSKVSAKYIECDISTLKKYMKIYDIERPWKTGCPKGRKQSKEQVEQRAARFKMEYNNNKEKILAYKNYCAENNYCFLIISDLIDISSKIKLAKT